jgi:hypothetical protein
MVKEVISYKTTDGRVFSEKKDAEFHAVYLINEVKIIEAIKKVKQLFKEDLVLFADSVKEYEVNLEQDFWEVLANDAEIDITVVDFKDFVFLIKTLLKNYHLEETVKIIKKIMCNDIKETT